jgi:non-ribosomal peptide synthetase component E (peptide arylation enzyme)
MVADDKGHQRTFGQVALESERVAAGLLACGARPGDVVSWQLPNGERACAVVVPASAADPPVLAELCAQLRDLGLSTRKRPEQLEFVGALPRNAMGKIVKRELVARFLVKETA